MKKTMKKAVMAVVAATLALSPVSVFAEEPKEVTIGIAWPSLGTQAWSAMADYLSGMWKITMRKTKSR